MTIFQLLYTPPPPPQKRILKIIYIFFFDDKYSKTSAVVLYFCPLPQKKVINIIIIKILIDLVLTHIYAIIINVNIYMINSLNTFNLGQKSYWVSTTSFCTRTGRKFHRNSFPMSWKQIRKNQYPLGNDPPPHPSLSYKT